jgi:preprotein translocase subunit YajC
MFGMLVPFVLIFGVFYLLVFAPMRKRQKKHEGMLAQLKAGDRVVTNGGIYGTVVGVSDDVIQLRIADQVKVDVAKSAVSGLQQAD